MTEDEKERKFPHVPVLLAEVVRHLEPSPGDVVLDGTVGSAGHAVPLLECVQPGGLLIGIDRDREILPYARKRLSGTKGEYHLAWALLSELPAVLERFGARGRLGGALFDLGVSSFQLDRPNRGFSFDRDGPLDLRMGKGATMAACELLARTPEDRIAELLRTLGEEPYSGRIARGIVEERIRRPLLRTRHLVEVIERVVPARRTRLHPATRTFQALRMAVNRELEELESGLRSVVDELRPGGRLAVISFHSLEDRMVKNEFRALVKAGKLSKVSRGVVKPTPEERQSNRRSRSAKMRVVERVG